MSSSPARRSPRKRSAAQAELSEAGSSAVDGAAGRSPGKSTPGSKKRANASRTPVDSSSGVEAAQAAASSAAAVASAAKVAADAAVEAAKGSLGGKRGRKAHADAKLACRFCERTFLHNVNRVQHYRVRHHEEAGVEILRYQCKYENCDAVYLDHSALRHHMDHVHENKIYLCQQCSSKFSSKTGLYHHRKSQHGPENSKKPSSQPATVRTAAREAAQEKASEVKQAEKKARVAAKIAKQAEAAATGHADDDELVRLYQCSECARRFSSKQSCINHINAVHLKKQFPCTFPNCGKRYSQKQVMQMHLKSHYGKIQCPVCKQSDFNTIAKMEAHKRTVHDHKCFRCPAPNCGREFPYKTSAMTHWKTSHQRHYMEQKDRRHELVVEVPMQGAAPAATAASAGSAPSSAAAAAAAAAATTPE